MIVYLVQHTMSAPMYSFIYPHVISILDIRKPKLREDFFQLLGFVVSESLTGPWARN